MVRIVAFVLLTAARCWGGTVCVDGTLTQYLAMGPGGCDIKADGITFFTTVTLSDFHFGNVSGDSNTTHIRVLPYPNPGSPGVTFTGASFAPVTLDDLITLSSGGYGSCECGFPGNLKNPAPASFWLIAPLAVALCTRRFQTRHLRNKVDLLTVEATH
jgi:hypothetical protein